MEHLHATIEEAAGAVRGGEVIGVPTDTLYGLAADPFDQNALEHIFEIKGRPGVKPLAVLVADLGQAQQIAAFSDRALDLAEEHWPGALTLVLPKLKSVPEWLGRSELRTVGLRCPDHDVALALLRVTGPLAVTSANISGQEGVLDDVEARALFGDEVAVYLPGAAPGGTSSTILDLTEPAEWVLREGPIQP
jgi:tRNA threonylcarbamoyl adenosine modification protein (Sua5/YciO/YrdC/YwlC family)